MLRMLIAPLILGVLVAAAIFFLSPFAVSASASVAFVGERVLALSNTWFETMPPLVARYLADLDLALVAATGGVLFMIVAMVSMAIWSLLALLFRILRWLLRLGRRKKKSVELPDFVFEPRRRKADDKPKIIGQGFDRIDRK